MAIKAEETVPQDPRAGGWIRPTVKGGSTQPPPAITLRAIVLGVLTIAATFYYVIQVGQRLRVGYYVHSQFPMAVFIPFVLWLFLNLLLKWVWPRFALGRGELLTIFSMMWVVGTIPQWGWMNFWTSILAAPTHFASPENQWAEIFFDYLPWHVFADTSSRVIDPFWFGLPEGMSIPWDGWVGTPLLDRKRYILQDRLSQRECCVHVYSFSRHFVNARYIASKHAVKIWFRKANYE